MLNTERCRRSDGVQGVAVQRSGDRVVVAHGADPAVFTGFGAVECGGRFGAVADLWRTDPRRRRRGGRGVQMHVVVVQTGQHGPARRVENVFAGPRRQVLGDIVDAIADPDLDRLAVQRQAR